MKLKLALVLSLMLVACATLMGDRTVTVSGNQIAQKLNEKLALPISVLKIFDVNLSNSLVTFDKGTGRLKTTMDTKLSSKLLGQTVVGKLGISGKLRFDAATSAIVLDDPKVEDFDLDGAAGQYREVLSALAKTVGGDMMNGLPLYTVKTADLRVGSTQYMPKSIEVTDNGLLLTLTPQK
jgi:hypothetical protein